MSASGLLMQHLGPCSSISSRTTASEEISKWALVVQVNSPYLEEHLMHMIKQDQNKVHNMDLLWRYYEKSCSFGKAAHVLARLSDMQRSDGFLLMSSGTHGSTPCLFCILNVLGSGLTAQHRDLAEAAFGIHRSSHSVSQEFLQHLGPSVRRRVPPRAGGKDGRALQ